MNIGDKIKAARKAKGLTQKELGEILGVQDSAIAKYEKGRIVNLKRSTLKRIADVLDLHPSELIFEAKQWEEMQKNNDTISDIIVRMRSDNDFLSVVEMLHKMDAEKIGDARNVLSILLK